MSLTPRVALMLMVPPLLWAGNAVVGHLAVNSLSALQLNALRWSLALVLLLPLGWRAFATAAARRALHERRGHLAILGLLGVGVYNALQYQALHTSTPLNITLIAASMPIWTMLFGVLFGVRPHLGEIIGIVLSIAGVATVLSRGDLSLLMGLRLVPGDLLMLVAIASWALYTWMLARPPPSMRGDRRPRWTWTEFLCVQMVFGLAWSVPAAGIELLVNPSRAVIHWSPALILILIYVAVGPSLIAFRMWGLGVAQAGPAAAGFFQNLTPLFAALLSAALLKQWPSTYHIIAFALIVGGIAVSSWTSSSRVQNEQRT